MLNRSISGFLMVFFCCTFLMRGQGGANGQIAGIVTDSSGAAIANATVTITNIGTNTSQQTKTSASGDFTVPYLIPGRYDVEAEAPGFSRARVQGVTVQVEQTARANLTLAVGQVSQAVTVKASAVNLDTEDAAVGQVITQRRIVDLPMNNRDFTNLLLLSPGAITVGVNLINGSSQEVISVSGARTTSNGFTIDGITNTDQMYAIRAVRLSLDAVQEFKEQAATYSAEYGQAASQINLTTRSGTNQLHGTAFDFIRNNDFDARSFFDLSAPPPLRQNDYGYSLGGPVYIPKIYNGRNHTFFFANFERLKATNSVTSYTEAPTSLELQGIFTVPIVNPITGQLLPTNSQGQTVIPKSDWSRLATVALAVPGRYFPVANAALSNGLNSILVLPNPTDNRQQTYRIDQVMGEKDSLFARFTLSNFTNTTSGATEYGNLISGTQTQSWVASETHSFSPSLINQARVGWLRYIYSLTGPAAPVSDLNALGLQNTYPVQGDAFPDLQVTGFGNTGGPDNVPTTFTEPQWEGDDSLTWVKGSHTITSGIMVRTDEIDFLNAVLPLGRYNFDGLATRPAGTGVNLTADQVNQYAFAEFLLGYISSGQAALPTGYSGSKPFTNYFHRNVWSAFVNDSWKATPRLTLNFGLRYDYQGVPYEAKNHYFWLNPNAPGGGVCVADQSLISSGVGGSIYQYCGRTTPNAAPKLPFAPRFGFAYSLTSDGNTVVRGGYGIFYDQFALDEFVGSGGFYPYVETYSPQGQSFNSLYPPVKAAAPAVPSDFGFLAVVAPSQIRDPYYQNWSLSVERQMGQNTKLTAAYVGSKGTNLETRVEPSQPYFYNPSNPAAGYPLTNFGTFGQNGTPFAPGLVINGFFGINSNYNALQLSAEHRSGDLALLASYTWGSAMDDSSGQSGVGLENTTWAGPMDAHDIKLDYSKSSFDVNQRLVTSFVYELPVGRNKRFGSHMNTMANLLVGGWQVNGILTFQSGVPYSINATDLGFVLQAYGQRANVVGAAYPAGFQRTLNEWFNTAAFAQPPEGVFGNSGRNVLRAPGIENFDASLFKNFAIKERATFQLRGEFYNALNHAQFGEPGTGVAGAGFGSITSVLVPGRIIQLAGKFVF